MYKSCIKTTFALLALMAAACSAWAAQERIPTRIVVVPFYIEEGAAGRDTAYEARHYRRIVKLINNRLTRNDFEVINPWAQDLMELEYNELQRRSRLDSPLTAQDMTRRYATDIAYIVWLDVSKRVTYDGFCKVRVRMEGEGYDSAARDLGLGVIKSFHVTRRDCEDAVTEAEMEVGELVGRQLMDHRWQRGALAASDDGSSEGANLIQRRADALENLLTVRLEGANAYELVEIFGKVLVTARGVSEAKNYRMRIETDNPQASLAVWRVRIEGTDPFRLMANVQKMIKDVIAADGKLTLKGVPYRYSADEVRLLKGIRTGEATTREVVFVVDRALARERNYSD